MDSVSRQKSNGGRQISVAGVLAYTALWALIICLFREAVRLQQGIHTIAQARLSDILMLIVTGLLFVAIGLPIAIVVGKRRQAVPVSLGCFLVGFIAIPILLVVWVTLGSFGVIDLDYSVFTRDRVFARKLRTLPFVAGLGMVIGRRGANA